MVEGSRLLRSDTERFWILVFAVDKLLLYQFLHHGVVVHDDLVFLVKLDFNARVDVALLSRIASHFYQPAYVLGVN